MATFKIPVSWEVFGIVEIEANSLDEAINIFDETSDDIPLPLENDYIDGSFNREDEETCALNNSSLSK
jgi:hypothetical protein